MNSKEHIVRSLLKAVLCAIALLVQVVGPATSTNADEESRQVVKVGSITLYVPRQWMSFSNFNITLVGGGMASMPSDKDYLADSVAILGRTLNTSTYMEALQLPTLISILAANPRYLKWQEEANAKVIAQALARGTPTQNWGDRILEIHPGLHVLIGSENEYRLGQPLMVSGSLSRMNSEFLLDRSVYASYRIAPDIRLRLKFDLRDFPPEKWAEMDRAVQKLISFLMTPD